MCCNETKWGRGETQCAAMQRALTKFTVKEVARTGRISLKRGEALLEMGGWGDGFRHNPPRDRAATPASTPAALQSVDGDVYMVDKAPHGGLPSREIGFPHCSGIMACLGFSCCYGYWRVGQSVVMSWTSVLLRPSYCLDFPYCCGSR